MFIWSLIWKVKVTYMPIVSFICSLFNANGYFFSFLVVANGCTFPSQQGFKTNAHKSLKIWSEFCKCSFWSYVLFSEMKITCMSIASFIFWIFTVTSSFSVLTLWDTFSHSYSNRSSKRTHDRIKNAYIC